MADNSFEFDQPWNPISYFEEETEDKPGKVFVDFCLVPIYIYNIPCIPLKNI